MEVTLVEGNQEELFVNIGPKREQIERRPIEMGVEITVHQFDYFGLENLGDKEACFNCRVLKHS